MTGKHTSHTRSTHQYGCSLPVVRNSHRTAATAGSQLDVWQHLGPLFEGKLRRAETATTALLPWERHPILDLPQRPCRQSAAWCCDFVHHLSTGVPQVIADPASSSLDSDSVLCEGHTSRRDRPAGTTSCTTAVASITPARLRPAPLLRLQHDQRLRGGVDDG